MIPRRRGIVRACSAMPAIVMFAMMASAAMAGIVPGRMSAHAGVGTVSLDAPGMPDSSALDAVDQIIEDATLIETPRRLVGTRSQLPLRPPIEIGRKDSDHLARLRLHAAKRDGLSMGDELARDLCGTASFTTTTPPPCPIV